MKNVYLLFVLLGWSACQRLPEIAPNQNPDQDLLEIGVNQFPVSFYSVNLSARTSVTSVTISGYVQVDKSQVTIREYGFCLSQTDSLPQITSATSRRIKATTQNEHIANATITDLTPGQSYYIDPYVILSNGRILYGRYNPKEKVNSPLVSAIRFQLPRRPVLQPVQLIARAPVPTPQVSGGVNTYFHQFFTMKGQVYSFYPTGALQAYNANADRWEPKADLGVNVFGTSPIVFTIDDKLYVHSSPNYWYGANRPLPSMWEYDSALDKWTDLGKSLGENLFNSQYQLSADGKAYFSLGYPYGILEFDAAKRQTVRMNKTNLLTNIGQKPYVAAANQTYYNAVWVPGAVTTTPGSAITKLVQYNPTSDQITDVASLNAQLSQQGYATSTFVVAQRTDLLTGFGSTSNLLINAGTVNASGVLLKDELVRYSTQEQRVTAYYDLSVLPNSQSYALTPLLVNDRLFVFNPSISEGVFTEVVFK